MCAARHTPPPVILADIAHPQEQPRVTGPESLMDCMLAEIMEAIFRVCNMFGLAIFEEKTEIMCISMPYMPLSVMCVH